MMGENLKIKIRDAKQAVGFVKWFIKYIMENQPYATHSIDTLEWAQKEIEGFILYDLEGNPRKAGES